MNRVFGNSYYVTFLSCLGFVLAIVTACDANQLAVLAVAREQHLHVGTLSGLLPLLLELLCRKDVGHPVEQRFGRLACIQASLEQLFGRGDVLLYPVSEDAAHGIVSRFAYPSAEIHYLLHLLPMGIYWHFRYALQCYS